MTAPRVWLTVRNGWYHACWRDPVETWRDRMQSLRTKDPRKAERERVKLEEQLEAGTLTIEDRVAFAEFTRLYESAYVLARGNEYKVARARSWATEKRALDGFVAYCRKRGITRADKVTLAIGAGFKKHRLAGGVAAATVNHDLRVVKAAFSWAAGEGGLLKAHPLAALSPIETPRKKIVWLRQADAEKVAQLAKKYQAGRAILLYLYLGLRLGEGIHAREVDVDFDANLFRVCDKPGEHFFVKDRQARTIPMAPEIRALLLSWRREDPQAILCPSEEGTHLCENNIRRTCKVIGKKIGAHVSPQILRRTFGSLLRQAGKPLDVISRYLGHSSVTVTEKWYADMDIDGDDAHVSALSFERAAPGTVVEGGKVSERTSDAAEEGIRTDKKKAGGA